MFLSPSWCRSHPSKRDWLGSIFITSADQHFVLERNYSKKNKYLRHRSHVSTHFISWAKYVIRWKGIKYNATLTYKFLLIVIRVNFPKPYIPYTIICLGLYKIMRPLEGLYLSLCYVRISTKKVFNQRQNKNDKRGTLKLYNTELELWCLHWSKNHS